jgi:hypothetical protein
MDCLPTQNILVSLFRASQVDAGRSLHPCFGEFDHPRPILSAAVTGQMAGHKHPLLWSLPMLPGRQLAAARRCQNLAAFVDHLSPTDRDDGPAGELPALKDGEFGVRQLVLIANRSLQVGIPDHHVGIGSHRDRSLARIEAKKLGRIRRRQRHHLLERDASRAHAFRVQQWQLDLKIVPRRSMVDDIECSATIMMAAYRQLNWPNRAVVE